MKRITSLIITVFVVLLASQSASTLALAQSDSFNQESLTHENIIVADLAGDLMNGVKDAVQSQIKTQKQPEESQKSNNPSTVTATDPQSVSIESNGARLPGESVNDCAERLHANAEKAQGGQLKMGPFSSKCAESGNVQQSEKTPSTTHSSNKKLKKASQDPNRCSRANHYCGTY